MNKYKVNNIYKEEGQTLFEIVSTYLIIFLDDLYNDDIMSLDTILNNRKEYQ